MLPRLLHDRRANTLVIMAVALIPISALAGSAVDMARLYVVKSRLQQACDAGVLAGRKFMSTTSTSTTLDTEAAGRARTFFKNNFQSGWLDTAAPTFVPVKTSDQQVAGTASVKVPMTIMKMFAAPDATIKVACKARYDIADTDIVFVLDTTGSMACRPEHSSSECDTFVQNNPAQVYTRPTTDPDGIAMPGYLGSTSYAVPETTASGGSRIRALRQAVKDFYATVAASVDTSTRVRYGFVTYTSTVNAGRAIQQVNPAFLLGGLSNGETARYQTRVPVADYQVDASAQNAYKSRWNCPTTSPVRNPAAPLTYNTGNGRATFTWQRYNDYYDRCEVVTQWVGPYWAYREADLDVSRYVSGVTVDDPTDAYSATTRWDGCIEERRTEAGVTSFTSNSFDLDPNRVPGTDVASRWKPMWADVTWARRNYNSRADQFQRGDNGPDDGGTPVNAGSDSRRRSGDYSCGKPIRRLRVMSAAEIAAYVDAPDFRPLGGTYHDTGMIWGVRMLARDGIFAADNIPRTGQQNTRKVIVFLTDGDMSPNEDLYGLYGIEYYERRVGGTSGTSLKELHNARFKYECQRANDLGMDVWTVAIGLKSTDELTKCASSSGQALYTTSGSGLSAIFQQIAKQVAMLRLDQ